MNSDSLYRSLTHARARAHTHARARSLSVFLKKIASKMCEILCKKSNEHSQKKTRKDISVCGSRFPGVEPRAIKTDEKRILFVPTITIDSVRSEALVLCSFLLTR